MAQSTLTVRTLGLAMVALVLACVHAARGDGRGGGVATISGSRVAASSGSKGGGVVTVRGDPWRPTANDKRAAAARKTASANVFARGKPKDRNAPHDPPVCVVRRPGQPAPVAPPAPIPAATAAATAQALASTAAQPTLRNAFYLSPGVASLR